MSEPNEILREMVSAQDYSRLSQIKLGPQELKALEELIKRHAVEATAGEIKFPTVSENPSQLLKGRDICTAYLSTLKTKGILEQKEKNRWMFSEIFCDFLITGNADSFPALSRKKIRPADLPSVLRGGTRIALLWDFLLAERVGNCLRFTPELNQRSLAKTHCDRAWRTGVLLRQLSQRGLISLQQKKQGVFLITFIPNAPITPQTTETAGTKISDSNQNIATAIAALSQEISSLDAKESQLFERFEAEKKQLKEQRVKLQACLANLELINKGADK